MKGCEFMMTRCFVAVTRVRDQSADIGSNTGTDLMALATVPKRAHPDLNQGPADLQSAALTTELCTHWLVTSDKMGTGTYAFA